MSASDPSSKIDMLDTAAQVKKKIKTAFCEPGNVENNGVLSFCKHVLFPLSKNKEFIVPRQEKYGGNMIFKSYEELEEAFKKGEEVLHPGDLKAGCEAQLNKLLEPIRKEFESEENKILIKQAYPVDEKKK
jgi:tyrosyl-tRNA synthetase